MTDFQDLLSSPQFMMGLGLLANRGNFSGGLLGAQFANQQQLMAQKKAQQEARNQFLQGLAPEQQAYAQAFPNQFGQAYGNQMFAAPKDRKVIQGADGFNYYQDTGERVLPGVKRNQPPTSAMQNYQYLLGQGVSPQVAQERAFGKMTINTGNQQLPTEAEILREDTLSRAGEARDFIKGVMDVGYDARGKMAEYDRALTLLETVQTGPFQENLMAAKRMASQIGLDVDLSKVSSAEELRVLLGNEVMSRVGETKGAISEKEMDLFIQYSANFGNTPEGNRKILEFKKAKATRDMELMKIVRDMRKSGKTSPEIQEAVMDYVNEHDISSMLQAEEKPQDVTKRVNWSDL
jgi:hypothetical protein